MYLDLSKFKARWGAMKFSPFLSSSFSDFSCSFDFYFIFCATHYSSPWISASTSLKNFKLKLRLGGHPANRNWAVGSSFSLVNKVLFISLPLFSLSGSNRFPLPFHSSAIADIFLRAQRVSFLCLNLKRRALQYFGSATQESKECLYSLSIYIFSSSVYNNPLTISMFF